MFANSLKIVQYNVEWLFIDYFSRADCPGNGCSWKTKSDAETHLKTISDVISKINPDIINFCEVEGMTELNMLVENLGTDYKPYFVKGKDNITGQNVGLLSKFVPTKLPYRTENRCTYPIPGSKCGYEGEPKTTGVSKHLISEFLICGDIKVALITAHLIAFPTDVVRCAEREAQATVLQEVIRNYLELNYEVIFMGDLNDFDGKVLDANNDKPKSAVLEILKVNDTLTSVAEFIPKSERYTDWYDKNGDGKSTPNEFSMIDHILVSKGLKSRVKDAYIYHGYTEEKAIFDSDHYPVVLELE